MNRKITSYYFAAQSGKGSEATIAATDAIEITFDSAVFPFKKMANDVVRNNIRVSNLPQKTLPIGGWGENPGDLVVELHGSGTVGTAPEFGVLIKSLFGDETVVASTSVTYSMPSDNTGDDTWYTTHSFVDGVKVAGVDTRCRLWGLDAAVGEIITQRFNTKALTATHSDLADPNTPVVDNLDNPFVGDSITFTIDTDGGGAATKCAKALDVTVERPKVESCMNNKGISDLPEDSSFTIAGNMTVDAEDDTEFTNYFDSLLSDIVLAGTVSNGGVSETVTVTLLACQYGPVDGGDDDMSVEYSVPFVCTGGVTIAFT